MCFLKAFAEGSRQCMYYKHILHLVSPLRIKIQQGLGHTDPTERHSRTEAALGRLIGSRVLKQGRREGGTSRAVELQMLHI